MPGVSPGLRVIAGPVRFVMENGGLLPEGTFSFDSPDPTKRLVENVRQCFRGIRGNPGLHDLRPTIVRHDPLWFLLANAENGIMNPTVSRPGITQDPGPLFDRELFPDLPDKLRRYVALSE